MWQGFTIALREGIEAFLIVALTLAYLKRTGRPGLARAVYAAIAVSVVTCVGAGLLFSKAANQPLWEGVLALVAAALVGSLLVYMKRVSKHLKSDIEARIESRAAGGAARAFWGVFAFALLMITREGMETALLVATALFQLKSAAVVAGLGLGLVGAAAIGFFWTRLGKGVDLKTILNVSSVFLAIFLCSWCSTESTSSPRLASSRPPRRSTTRPRFSAPTDGSATCSPTRSRSSRRPGSPVCGGSDAAPHRMRRPRLGSARRRRGRRRRGRPAGTEHRLDHLLETPAARSFWISGVVSE